MARKLNEIYAPKPQGEKEFVAKHTIKKTTDKSPATKDDKRFNASNIKTIDRSAKRMGYNPGADVKAYDSNSSAPNDQKTVTAIAPYTVKMGEDVIDEGNLINKKKKDAYIKSIGKDKAKRPNATECKKAGRAELRKEDIEINDDNIDMLIDLIDQYLLTKEEVEPVDEKLNTYAKGLIRPYVDETEPHEKRKVARNLIKMARSDKSNIVKGTK